MLTDFGTDDGFVGAVKAVLATLAPELAVDDVGHDIPRGDVRAAARALARYWLRYPAGTIHMVVVDPGVGTARRGVACAATGRLLVAPDNGVLTPVLRSAPNRSCVQIEEAGLAGPVSPTFHGRDVFAPAAAALAGGRHWSTLGPPITDPVLLPEPQPVREGRGGRGEVVGVDRFGNVTTNLPGSWAWEGAVIEVAGQRLTVRRSYGEAGPGEPLALIDSEGWIELAVRDGSASALFDLVEGTPVWLPPS